MTRHSWTWIVLAAALACAASTALAQTRIQYDRARQRLVDEILATAGVKNERVLQAMRDTPRHEFVEPSLRSKAYYDMALPIGEQQTISSPLIVSQMTQALDPQPTDKVLEIGTGSGYQAAVLSPLVREVYTIEIVESLGKRAEKKLKELGYKNIHVKVGDGYLGWPEHAPFDKIIVTCSPEKVPQPLVDQLVDGGFMVIPVGQRYSQTLYLMRKTGGKLESEALLPTLFVPMTGQAEAQRAVKPDPTNPRVVNGSFEEPAFPTGGQPGWYYERQVAWVADAQAPDGQHFVEFKNQEPGVPAHLLQGFGIDGRSVTRLEVKGWVKTDHVVPGPERDASPYIVVTLYDGQRKELEHLLIGPFHGTAPWTEVSKVFRIPPEAREGILRIGLFGATGSVAFDHLQMAKTVRP